MKKSEKLSILLNNPLRTLFAGVNARKEEFYRSKVQKKYGIDRLPSIDLCELFPDLNETIINYTYLDGTSLPIDIMLLKSFARGFNNCSYLEIGSWRGESISNVYEITNDCTAVTLPEDEMYKISSKENYIKINGFFSKKLPNLKTVEQNSRTFNFESLNKKFDLIFIDGDHAYEGVLNDTMKTLPLRRDSSSVIVWHDYGYSTENVRHSVLAGILDGIPVEKHGNLYHVSNTLCAVYIEDRKFRTYYTEFPSTPDKVFTINIVAKKI